MREATPEDARAVGEVHQCAIRELGASAYTAAQVAAWHDDRDPADYELDLEGRHFVVAEREARAERAPRTGSGDQREPRAEAAPGDHRVVGFGDLLPEPESEFVDPVDAEVAGCYVHPEHAREGVGSALLADLEATAREWGADSVGLHASLNAVAFYERKGYDRLRERDHEFGGGETGTVVEMRRTL